MNTYLQTIAGEENHVAIEEGIENRFNSLSLWLRKLAELMLGMVSSDVE